jgi:deazaflavin-dependent oxidoreductase (nitroreductase family)
VPAVGIADELDYHHRRANAFQRLVQRFASTRAGGWFFSVTLRHLDAVVAKVSRGRTSAPEVLAGLPVLQVTTTGRRSGVQRRTFLISVPVGDTLALLGTNFGQASTPAWVLNLEADPRAIVTHRDHCAEVRARPASEDERAQVMASSANIYGGYLKYQERVGESRRVRIFVLEPADRS